MLRLANDIVAWNKYPWGSYVWPTLYSQLRNANIKHWSPLYIAQPTNEDDVKTYSIFRYTWAFTVFDRYNRYPRVAAWIKKKERFLGHMVIPFFQRNMPAARLTPDDNEARSDWWISSKAYFDGFIGQVERGGPSSFQRHVNSLYFNMGMPSNFQTPVASQPGSYDWKRQMPTQSATQHWQPDISSQPGSYYSFGQVPSHMGRPNLQTTIETHHDVDGIFDQNIPNRGKREQFSSKLPYGTPIGWLSGEHMNSWMELLIRRRNTKANWTVAYTGTISVHSKNNRFIILTDQHVIGTLDDPTRPYPAWNDVDWEDRVRQLAMMNLAHEFKDASTAKDELGKAYEKCRDIPLEQRDLIDFFLKTEAELD
nr:hypothetical protein [Tanacetum cinerariifolium]